MRIMTSTVQNFYKDFYKTITAKNDEDIFAFFTTVEPVLLDCTGTFGNDKLPDLRYSDAVTEDGLTILRIPVKGGSIVFNKYDLGILYITNDLIRKWHLDAIQWIKDFLERFYKKERLSISNNDILLDGKKFCGTAHAFMGGYQIGAVFLSVNNSEKLINKYCVKPSEHKGFTGIPGRYVDDVLKYLKNKSRQWESEK